MREACIPMSFLFGSVMGRPIFFNNKLDGEIGFYDVSDLASLNINLDKVPPWLIYVFGSNRKGIHGAGAALYARNNFGVRMDKEQAFKDGLLAYLLKTILSKRVFH